jgi:membrane protease subunit (stomatin/prohibitin family)
MTQNQGQKRVLRNTLLSGMALLTMMACVDPAWAILGVWRRTAMRTAVVYGAAETGAAASANASMEAAAAASAQSAAAASQAAAAANQAAAAATAKTPQQKLAELQSLYDQRLISQSDYEAAKQKILSGLTN